MPPWPRPGAVPPGTAGRCPGAQGGSVPLNPPGRDRPAPRIRAAPYPLVLRRRSTSLYDNMAVPLRQEPRGSARRLCDTLAAGSAMHPERRIRLSKFLTLILRHRPEQVGLVLGARGRVPLTTLVEAPRGRGGGGAPR